MMLAGEGVEMDEEIIDGMSAAELVAKQEDEQLSIYFKVLAQLNNALDNVVYLLSAEQKEKCFEAVRELLEIVVKINIEMDELVCRSDRKEELTSRIDKNILEIANRRSRFFESAQTDSPLFENANTLIYQALDAMTDIDGCELEINVDEVKNETEVFLFQTSDGRPPLSPDVKFEDVSGIKVGFNGEQVSVIEIGKVGNIAYRITFEDDGETCIIEDEVNDALPSISKPPKLPLLAGAAFVAAVVAVKAKDLIDKRKVATKLKEQVQEKMANQEVK